MVERRRSDDAVDFRVEVLRRLQSLEDDRKGYHAENVLRLKKLEAAAVKVSDMVDDWNGNGHPEDGMRPILKQIIDERKNLGFGWRFLIGLGSIIIALFSAYTAVATYLGGHK